MSKILSSDWRPPGFGTLILIGLIANCFIGPTLTFPFKEGSQRLRRREGVISLPAHFKVDDPERSFGRRIPHQDQIVQASTIEEVKASRVRKRTFSASVISERTIQIEDDTNSLKSRGPEKNLETTQRTRGGGLGSSTAYIKYVSTVPPAPFGSRTSTSVRGAVEPTLNPVESEQKKVTIRTVLRRPPSRNNNVPNNNNNPEGLSTTTQRRTRVRLQDSLLARVQGKLRARSTTPSTMTTLNTSVRTTQETLRSSSERISTTQETLQSSSERISTTVETTPPEQTTLPENEEMTKMDDLVTTTFIAPTTTETEEEQTDVPVLEEEEEVVTETSVAMSIGESEAHKILMTTVRNEDTTFDDKESSATRTSEGILGSSLERPDGLQKELLAAIRRKISRTRENQSTPKKLNISDTADIDVSPSSNAVGSTQQPPFFRPILFPTQERNRDTRVKLFLRVNDEKSGSALKIPNFSRIQGKLARLNAAITEGLRNDQLKKANISTTSRPRIGAYTTSITSTTSTTTSISTTSSTTTTTIPTTTTTKTTTTTTKPTTTETTTTSTSSDIPLSLTDPSVVPAIAEKTHTYLDILRKRYRESSTDPPFLINIEESISSTTTEKIKPAMEEHPTSHFRPREPEAPLTTTQRADVKIVTPKYGDFVPPLDDIEEKERIVRNNAVDESDSVIHDITGTTVYVVGVICIIPAAGLVAWVVRYVVKRRVLPNSENGSETGLNCPISDEDMMQVNQGKSNQVGAQVEKRKSMCQDEDSIDETMYTAQESLKEELVTSVWQISRQNLRLLTVLGEGNFGKVWKAEAENICGYDGTVLVAVKTTKEKAPDKEKSDLLQEMQIMQKIGHHPNVVTLLGVSIDKEPYLLVMEYVMYGKLLTHLRDQRSKQTSLFHFTEEDLQQPSEDSNITAKDLTKYAYGVAKGMEYIVSKNIIHRDLAARNILLDHTRCCKISDFGLSRNLGDTGSEMYEQKTKGALPIRWMAPESLYFSVFTPKSDVWSFGILMWEIVTLGSTPYPGMGAREVMRRVRDGYRLERPSHCHPDLYKIISKCWAGDMNKRPDFTELRLELAKLLEHQHGYIDLHNIPENKYYSMTQTSDDEDEKL